MRIRAARVDDLDFVMELTPQLTEFGAMPGRDPVQMAARDREVLEEAIRHPSPETAVFMAEDEQGRALGFIHLATADDYYTDSITAHVADIVVAPAARRQGVGIALLAHAEEWARAHGFALLTLNVFTANRGARDLYTRRGFHEEWIRCIKRL